MSVLKRSYRRYTGPVTSQRTRFVVLMRYAAAEAWKSRVTNILFVLSFVPALISASLIYVLNNVTVQLLLTGGSNLPPPFAANERFFLAVLQSQCWPALVLTAWIGPKLIAGDLANDALPTLLSHQSSRIEYIAAKLSVLACFLSATTVVPTSLLYVFQSYLSQTAWGTKNLHILFGMFAGCVLWIGLLSLLALALAAWVKWRIVATGLVFAALFIPAGVGAVFNEVMRSEWGNLINIPVMMTTVWRRLLHVNALTQVLSSDLPTPALLAALACICLVCVAALNARIRAREVVRG